MAENTRYKQSRSLVEPSSHIHFNQASQTIKQRSWYLIYLVYDRIQLLIGELIKTECI